MDILKWLNKYFKIIILSILGAIFLLFVFAAFAPLIFTQNNATFGFMETGQIGDTIGGTMGPIVAIAGVLMTFIAFLIQVRANEIQRAQIRKSYELKTLDMHVECIRALQLLKVDIQNAINNINVRCSAMSEFVEELSKKPFFETHLKQPTITSVERYSTLNRNLLYNGVQLYLIEDSKEIFLTQIYNTLDFYIDSVKELNSKLYQPYAEEIMSIKREVPDIFRSFVEKMNSRSLEDMVGSTQNLLKLFNNECVKVYTTDGGFEFNVLDKILLDKHFYTLFEDEFLEYQRLNNKLTKIKLLVNQLAAEFSSVQKMFLGDDVLKILEFANDRLGQVLNDYTEEKIKNNFYQTFIE